MATSFEVIFLGTLAKIDTTQGNEIAENAAGILGTYGTAGTPLANNVRFLTPDRVTEDESTTYDTDNGGGYDSFKINGGVSQNFDAVATYNAVLTHIDGTTANVVVTVFQDVNGNTYLAPMMVNDANQQALTAAPIQSLSLNGVVTNTGDMAVDRVAGDFKSIVDGTSGNDSMGVGYTDAQGDKVTEGNDYILAGAGNDTINAGGGNDTVYGGDGADSINGGTGTDTIYGGSGNDTVVASSGYDVVYGGDGNDSLTGGPDSYDDLYGGAGDDTLIGGSFDADWVYGGSGQDLLYGGDGNMDVVGGGTGNDTAYGGNGNDLVVGGTGNDSVFGGAGNDTVSGDDGADTVDAGTGNDTVSGGAGADSIIGGDGADIIRGDVLVVDISNYASTANGPATQVSFVNASGQPVELFWINGSGMPVSYGVIQPGQSSIVSTFAEHNWALRDTTTGEWVAVYTGDVNLTNTYSGAGADTIAGGQGADTIYGDAGNDNIDAGTENDQVFGGSGNDTVYGGWGDDTADLGDGDDSFGDWSTEGGSDLVYGGAGNDRIIGGGENDTLYGGTGNDTLSGGIGTDSIFGGEGNDAGLITEDHGIDTYDMGENAGDYDELWFGNWQTTTGVNLTFSGTDAGSYGYSGGGASGQFSGVEGISGTSYADTINAGADTDGVTVSGNGGADSITGGSGSDLIDGGAGNDTINFGLGNNTVFGGDGDDAIDDTPVSFLSGNNLIYAGSGNDTVWFGAGDTTVYGGAGNDAIDDHGGSELSGTNLLYGGDGADTIAAGLGNDSVSGDAGNDRLLGESGNDLIFGGGESDTILGGDGDDTLDGGTGDDNLTGGAGNDTFQFSDASGNDRITDFNLTRVDGRTIDQFDVSDLSNAEGDPVTWRDVTVSDTNGDGSGDATLIFPNGETIVMEGVSPWQVQGKQNMAAMGIPCFATGTLLQTSDGLRAVETLMAGAQVLTREGGAKPILWVGMRNIAQAELASRPSAMPVRVASGALGNAGPLLLSQQHAVLMQSAAHGEVLVQIGHLASAGFGGIRMARGVRRITYHHILLPQHAVLIAQGAAAESLYPGPQALLALSPLAQIALAQAILQQTAHDPAGGFALEDCVRLYGPRYRPLLKRSDVMRLHATRALTPVIVSQPVDHAFGQEAAA